MQSLVYWRLAPVYFFYFCLLGILIPYLGPYLEALGYSGLAIGFLTGLLSLTKVIAPNFWGYCLDHTPVSRWPWFLYLGAWAAAASFAFLPWVEGFWALVAVIFFFSFFWNAILPQMEVIVFQTVGSAHYSRVRLFGSLGFIVAVGLGGWFFHSQPLAWLPWLALPLFLFLAISLFFLPSAQAVQSSPQESWRHAWQQPGIVAFFLAVIFLQGSHGAYYSFYSLYLENQGYGSIGIGVLWALGVLVEILLFWLLPHFLPGKNLVRLMQWAAALTALRWALLAAFPQHWPLLIVVQFFHALSYGLFHTAAIALVQRLFGDGARLRGQGLYSSLGYGLGVAVGSILAGFFWQHGLRSEVYWFSVLFALLALWLLQPLGQAFALLALFSSSAKQPHETNSVR
jgi:PPP family 3-phenylpropionic acid transporter